MGLVTAAIYTAVTLAFFPARLQFAKYPRAAEQYLAGTLPPERLLDFSPFYFYLHVLQGALLSGEVVVFLQIVVVAATAVVLFLLLRDSFGLPIAALGAGALVLSKSVMVYAVILEPETFLLLFLCAFLYYALREGPRDPLYAGAFLALCLSVRPSVLPLLVVLPIHYLVRDGRRAWLRSSALALAPSLALLLLLTLRNGVATGEYTPLGMNPGFVFFEGNNPLSSGRSSVYPPVVGELKQEIVEHPDNPHLTYRLISERVTGRELSTGEANRYWRGKALAFIADHPGRFLSLLGDKTHALLQSYRRHDLVPAQRYDEALARVPGVPFALLIGCALLGAVLALPRWRQLLPVYALLVGQTLLMLLMYVSDRQRLALFPALVFFAAAAVASLREAPRARQVTLAAVVLAATVLFMLPSDLTREDRHVWQTYERADRARELAASLRDEGRLAEAREMAAFGYAAAPWLKDWARPGGVPVANAGITADALALVATREEDASLRFDRGTLLLEAGDLDAAEEVFHSLIDEARHFDRGYYESSEPRYYLAKAAAARGRTDDATRLLQEALEHTPGDPFVLAELVALTGEATYAEQIVRYFGEADADYLIGLAGVRDHVRGASRGLERTVKLLPELWRAQIYLAVAVGDEGDPDRAGRLYQAATADRWDPALLEERILPILREAAATRPDDAGAGYRYGAALAQYGHFDEALAALRAARSIGVLPEIDRAISDVERRRSGVP